MFGKKSRSFRMHRNLGSRLERLESRQMLAGDTVLFADSFESGAWNGNWVEDSQSDWFISSQRETDGNYSAEVDGRANDATLTLSTPLDLRGYASAEMTFNWYIESGFDWGEYLALDISSDGGNTWQNDVRRLNGNYDAENTWLSETVDLKNFASSELLIRFRSYVSRSNEDANVDNVTIVGTADPVLDPAIPVKVFVMAGQSNMTGTALAENLDPDWNTQQDDVFMWLDNNMDGVGNLVNLEPGHGWLTHAPSPAEPEGLFLRDGKLVVGPELSLGRTLAETYPDHQILLVKHGDGGRDLVSDFNPENTGPPESNDHMWSGLLQKTDDAFEALDAAGADYEVAGFFWSLGARDARNWNSDSTDPDEVLAGEKEALARSAAYGENLTNFIQAVRDEYSDDLPFVMSRMSDNIPPELLEEYPGAELVRQGQLDVAATVPWTEAFTTDEITKRDAVHFDAMGQIEFGKRFANFYLDLATTPFLPPVADDDAYGIAEDGVLDVGAPGVLDGDSDPENDSLSAALVNGPTHGAVSLAADGSFIYMPDVNFNGTDSFTYRATDGTSSSNEATVTIDVTPVNDSPVADTQFVETEEDTPVGITLSGSDIDGDALTFDIVDGPTNGTLSGAAPNLTYTPAAGYAGADYFTFRVNDGTVDSTVVSVSITVTEINHPPVADSKSLSTDEDTATTVTLSGSDPDGDPLSYEALSGPTNGTLSGTVPNLTYTPDENFHGSDSFTYLVSDGENVSEAATVSISIASVNDLPVAANESFSLDQDSTLNVPVPGVLQNDVDVDGDSLVAQLASGPANGSVTLNADGSFAYTPNAGFVGTDSFSYRASDGIGVSPLATASLAVNEVPDISRMHVADLDGAAQNVWFWWRAVVSIRVVDQDGNAVADATVSGQWSGGSSGSTTVTTDSNGWATVYSGYMSRSSSETTFTVASLSHVDYEYDALANEDPDDDSSGTSIRVFSNGGVL